MSTVRKLAKKAWNRLRPKNAWERSWYKTLRSFSADEYNRMVDLDLTEASIAIDVGGHTGDFTKDIFSRSACRVHVIEPIPVFAEALRQRFRRNRRITVHAVALGSRDRQETLFIDDDATSAFKKKGAPINVSFVDAGSWLDANKIDHVDLLALNCEGGEYELLPRLIELGFIAKASNIVVQFHRYSPQDETRRSEIVAAIEKTHRPVISYPFVWESWERLPS